MGNYIQSPGTDHNEKESEKRNAYMCVAEPLCCRAEIISTLKIYYTSIFLKETGLAPKCACMGTHQHAWVYTGMYGIQYMCMFMTWMCLYVWQRVHSHAYVGVSRIHLKIEGEELRKDQRASSSTSATGQLPISFLWFPRSTQWLPLTQPWKYISFKYSMCHPVMDVQGLLRHRQYDVSLRHVSQKIGYPQNEFEGWKKSVFFKPGCRTASSMQDSNSALLPFPKRRRWWGSLTGNLALSQ